MFLDLVDLYCCGWFGFRYFLAIAHACVRSAWHVQIRVGSGDVVDSLVLSTTICLASVKEFGESFQFHIV